MSSNTVLTRAIVKTVDPTAGTAALNHGALKNVGMSAMTTVFKTRDLAMVEQVRAGDKVMTRVESINDTMAIVKMEKNFVVGRALVCRFFLAHAELAIEFLGQFRRVRGVFVTYSDEEVARDRHEYARNNKM